MFETNLTLELRILSIKKNNLQNRESCIQITFSQSKLVEFNGPKLVMAIKWVSPEQDFAEYNFGKLSHIPWGKYIFNFKKVVFKKWL